MDREPTPARRTPGEILGGFDRRTFIVRGAAGAGALLIARSSFPEWARATAPPPLSSVFPTPPFSFTYNGTASSTLLSTWTKTSSSTTLADGSVQTTTVWDSGTDLKVTWVATQYPNISNVKWVVWFENTSRSTSAVLEDVLALDLDVGDAANGPATSNWTVHTAVGSNQATTDFQPLDVSLASGGHRLFCNVGGRPTNYASVPGTSSTFLQNGWPYFNVEWGGRGMIVAVGWPGQWAFEAYRTADQALTLQAGMCSNETASNGDHITTSGSLYLTKVQLDAGERVRTPQIVVQSWTSGTVDDAQNAWRQWLLAYHLHQVNGSPPQPLLAATQYHTDATAGDHIAWIDAYANRGRTASGGGHFSHWWMDAGWYSSATTSASPSWWPVGTWTVSSTRFPNGLNEVFDHARTNGLSGILWFEPERVYRGTWLATNEASWLLGSGDDKLFDFGNSSAQSWAVTTFNGLINGADVNQFYNRVPGFYREDFNINPLPYWNAADPTGQFGITQMRHVAGHLDYWASILSTNSGLRIDTCASGGRRMDVQTLEYAISLLRSDLVAPPVTAQCQQYGLSRWLPVSGNQAPGNGDVGDGYLQRSAMAPCYTLPVNVDDPGANWGELPRTTAEWSAINAAYAGDYYPLSAFSTTESVWMAWQFNKTDASAGFAQAFRRIASSGSEAATFNLDGLNRAATYGLTLYYDANRKWSASAGYSDTQGVADWHYQKRDKSTGAYSDMTYSSGTWTSPGGGYVQATAMHPDNSYDAVRKWVAPVTGRIRITGAVAKLDTSGGNGVVASVLKNGTTLWTKTIAYNDGIGYSTNDDLDAVDVSAGDAIYFVVSNNGDYSYDATSWNPMVTLLSWTGSDDFSGTQGFGGWTYEARDVSTGSYSDLTTYSSSAWYAPSGIGYVASGSMHPDSSYDTVRTWIAPEDCHVAITGRAYKQLTGGGNGVIVSVLQNTTTLWSKTIAYNDTTGYSTDADLTDVAVRAGDAIRFVIQCNGTDYSYDATYWDPTITQLPRSRWSASSDFGSTQGANDWYYEARDVSTSAYSAMTYSSGAWYAPSGIGYVASGSMHPDDTYDSVRKWVAPNDGRFQIRGRAYKQLTGGGNGVIVSVLQNSTTLWSKTIAYNDTTGYKTDDDLGDVTVRAGDAIRFVIQCNGTDYSYDATYWDPTIVELPSATPTTRSLTAQTGASLEDTGLSVAMHPGQAVTVAYVQQ